MDSSAEGGSDRGDMNLLQAQDWGKLCQSKLEKETEVNYFDRGIGSSPSAESQSDDWPHGPLGKVLSGSGV